MKKIIALFLAMVLCFGLIGCGVSKEQQESIAKEQAEALSFQEQVTGCWDYVGGWTELGGVLEFNEDGTCLINEKEFKWEATTNIKPGTSSTVDFANVYEGDVLMYESYINIWDNGTISLVIYQTRENEDDLILHGTYVKANHTHE